MDHGTNWRSQDLEANSSDYRKMVCLLNDIGFCPLEISDLTGASLDSVQIVVEVFDSPGESVHEYWQI